MEKDEGEVVIVELDVKLEEEEVEEVTVFDVDFDPLDEEMLLPDFELAVDEEELADVVEVFDADSLPDVEEEP